MNHLVIIREFLRQPRQWEDAPESGLPFVTISRQSGAGGHLLSYLLLTEFLRYQDEELFQGWHVFDRELCEAVALDPTLHESVEALLTEQYRSEAAEYIDSLFTGRSGQYRLYKTTFRVVRHLARVGKVIIVGRAGACATRGIPNGVHVRLVAPEAQRTLWLMKKMRTTREQARRTMLRHDADRQKAMRAFFNRDVDDPLLYDVVWNTAAVGLEDIARSIIDLLRRRSGRFGAARQPSDNTLSAFTIRACMSPGSGASSICWTTSRSRFMLHTTTPAAPWHPSSTPLAAKQTTGRTGVSTFVSRKR